MGFGLYRVSESTWSAMCRISVMNYLQRCISKKHIKESNAHWSNI